MEQAAQTAEDAAARTAGRHAAAIGFAAAARLGGTARLGSTAGLSGARGFAAIDRTAACFAAAVVVSVEQALQAAKDAAARTASRHAAAIGFATATCFATAAWLTTTTTQPAEQAAEGKAVRACREHDAHGERRQYKSSVHRETPEKWGGKHFAVSASPARIAAVARYAL